MKIYFTASARSKKHIKRHVVSIFRSIELLGHSNLDDLIMTVEEDQLYNGNFPNPENLLQNAIKYIRKAEVIVLEVSEPSISMGYVMHVALEMNKPVVLLHIKDKFPVFVSGVTTDKLQVIEYSLSTLTSQLQTALDFASSAKLIRFNFFISPEQDHHLLKMSRELNKPKSVYLRELIQGDMNQ